ncbi:hypothetical protein PMIN01_04077 [Paraphaeosphaeria minitans]|uniref:Uncharacterized protein n=1 Tax=Paraphaeosphaeria minitans TaxID=565426 RepID=A0A9P6GNR7_9PLEO|nr:hypothetical protein PMIN01_04077 [Paraphaeosphaeria minitans]
MPEALRSARGLGVAIGSPQDRRNKAARKWMLSPHLTANLLLPTGASANGIPSVVHTEEAGRYALISLKSYIPHTYGAQQSQQVAAESLCPSPRGHKGGFIHAALTPRALGPQPTPTAVCSPD